MNTVVIIVVAVIVLAALAGAGFVILRRRRTQQLQQQFGPEYDKVLAGSESRSEAESALSSRQKRHESLDLRSLDPATREKFHEDWKRIQGSFVDDPGGAVEHADSLVTSIMRERGYPLDDFDQRAADISVEHPRVVENYREARRVHDAHRSGTAGTEDLREAVSSYRNLVEALLDESGDDGRGTDGRGTDADRDRREGGAGREDGDRPRTAGGASDRQSSGERPGRGAEPTDAAPGGARDGSRG